MGSFFLPLISLMVSRRTPSAGAPIIPTVGGKERERAENLEKSGKKKLHRIVSIVSMRVGDRSAVRWRGRWWHSLNPGWVVRRNQGWWGRDERSEKCVEGIRIASHKLILDFGRFRLRKKRRETWDAVQMRRGSGKLKAILSRECQTTFFHERLHRFFCL